MHTISIIVFLIVLSLVFAAGLMFAGIFASPKSEAPVNNSSLECGIEPFGANFSVNIGYFVYAIVFLIFDTEVILLFPFALAFEKLQFFVFIQAAIFIFLMLLSLFYAIQKNMLRIK